MPLPHPRLLALVVLTACAFTIATPSPAQPIPGADAPAFIEARDLWLTGDDLPALQALAALAREDNTAAQMLLSGIATATHTHAHVTGDMPRRERIALLREERGISGRDWMLSAAEAHPLAEAIADLRFHNRSPPLADQIPLIERLIEEAENRLAFAAVYSVILHRGSRAVTDFAYVDLQQLGAPGDFLISALQHIQYVSDQNISGISFPPPPVWLTDQVGQEIAERLELAVTGTWAGSQRSIRSGQDLREREQRFYDYLSTLPALVEGNPDYEPLQRFCANTCPLASHLCIATALNSLTIAESFPYPLESPRPALIDGTTYRSSERFFADLRRRLDQGHWEGCPGQR